MGFNKKYIIAFIIIIIIVINLIYNIRIEKFQNNKKAFVYSHLGLGDHFWMNGAVRYLSTIYDEVMVVCKKRN